MLAWNTAIPFLSKHKYKEVVLVFIAWRLGWVLFDKFYNPCPRYAKFPNKNENQE